MSDLPTNHFDHLWNDLPKEERSRLRPYMIESQFLHVWQTKLKAIAAHKRLMAEIDSQLKYLKKAVNEYKKKGIN